MRYWLALFAFMLAVTGYANDMYVVGEGGRMQLAPGEHASIRMVREWVRLDAYPDYYVVAAQFVFHNEGPATEVKMGFPERGDGDVQGENYRLQSGFEKICFLGGW